MTQQKTTSLKECLKWEGQIAKEEREWIKLMSGSRKEKDTYLKGFVRGLEKSRNHYALHGLLKIS